MPLPSASKVAIFFLGFNDGKTIERMATKCLDVAAKVSSAPLVLLVDDGSSDDTSEIAGQLETRFSEFKYIKHACQLGYGAAIQSGIAAIPPDYDWVCFLDGDDQYDITELLHISKLFQHYDLIVCFRYSRVYSTWRIFLSFAYNFILRLLFRSPFRDVSCGMKMVKLSVLKDLTISSRSPFVGAEIAVRSMLKGYHIGEVGISTYPRDFGISTSTTLPNIRATVKDMLRVRREVFSNRPRNRET